MALAVDGLDAVVALKVQDLVSGLFAEQRAVYLSKEIEFLQTAWVELLQPLMNDLDIKLDPREKRSKPKSPDEYKLAIRSAFSSDAIDQVIQLSKGAMDRCKVLSEATSLADNVAELYKLLYRVVMDFFVKPIVQRGTEMLPPADPKQEPPTFFFEVAAGVNTVAQKLNVHYTEKSVMAIFASAGGNTQAILENALRELTMSVEHHVLSGLNSLLGSLLKFIERVLYNHQQRSDFRPKEEALFDTKCTKACDEVVQVIEAHYSNVAARLEGRNLDKYLTALGSRFHGILFTHLKKFSFSQLGAGVLARDLNEYSKLVTKFCQPTVDNLFDQLKHLNGLLFVSHISVGDVILQSGYLLSEEDIMSFLQMREDFSSNRQEIFAHLKRAKDAVAGQDRRGQ